jgi:hypothetical protein
MAQLKKFGIFDAISQYISQWYDEMLQGGYTKEDITGRFIHRGKKKRRAYRDGRARGWAK